MSDRPTQSVELLLLCGKVRDEALTAEDAARLEALLQASDQAKQLYVRYMSIVSLLESRGLGQPAVATDELQGEVMDHDAFAALLQYEEQADAQLVHQVGRLRSRGQSQWQVAGTLRWAIQNPAVLGSVAAILFLALVLVVVLNNGSEPTSIAVQPDEHTTPSIAPSVATVTAAHDAQWAERALARGSKLHAGDRLTLTAGFAEITTNDGAVAILEAPATVELLDNNNALRLHTGKLVGICETDSSKGFLVRTPHMDVTDLGTRFGVDASDADVTQVHVFKGEVEVTRPASIGGEMIRERLTDGQAVESRSGGVLAAIHYENDRFAANLRYDHLRPEFGNRSVVWSGQPRGDLRLHAAESDATQVFLEQANLLLDEDVVVDFNQTQEWAMDSTAGQHVVAAGQRVDVYLIHLDPPGESRINRTSEIHFDRPILGVIADESSLRKTDKTLGLPGVLYSDLRDAANQRGLDIHLDDTGSVINNGTSLRLLLNATQFLDEVRVLVLAKGAEQREVDR